MSTFTTSRGTRGQHVSPKTQTRPYRQSPARREYIHGKVQPMDNPYRQPAWYEIAVMLVVAALIGALLAGGAA